MSRCAHHDWFLSHHQRARRSVAKRRSTTGPSPYSRRLRLEPLEDRRLLALVTVTTLNDTVDFNDGVTSLREAIFATNLVGGADTIEFAPALTAGGPATILLTQGELAITDSLATELVSAALRQAIELRQPVGQELLHHSDRGCQYTSDAYQQTLKTLGIECSMSRTGECYDNAVAERFFWSLKHEWTKHETFMDLEAARLSVFKYIETFYNTVRLHQSLGYKSPNQFETEYAPVLAA